MKTRCDFNLRGSCSCEMYRLEDVKRDRLGVDRGGKGEIENVLVIIYEYTYLCAYDISTSIV